MAAESSAITGALLPTDVRSAEAEQQALAALLADGLTTEEAVQLGLAREPGLRASLQSVHHAVALLAAAGLPANPSLQAALRFPSAGGAPVIELGLLAVLQDLWQLDDREAAARADLELAVLRAADESVTLARTIRLAVVDCLASAEFAALERLHVQLTGEVVERLEAGVSAGVSLVSALDLARQRQLQAELVLAASELAAGLDRRRLVTLLGLDHEPADLVLSDTLPTASVALPSSAQLRSWALLRRLDLRAAAARVEQALARIDVEQSLAWTSARSGVSAEREDGWAVGPLLNWELPLVHRNEPAVAAARALAVAAGHDWQATRLAVLQDVALAEQRARTRQALVQRLDAATGEVLDAALARVREALAAGQTTVVAVLETQRSLLDTRRAWIAERAALARALAELAAATSTPPAALLRPEDAASPHDPDPRPTDDQAAATAPAPVEETL